MNPAAVLIIGPLEAMKRQYVGYSTIVRSNAFDITYQMDEDQYSMYKLANEPHGTPIIGLTFI